MGMSDKKTTSDSNTAFNQTTTPNVPSWISDPAQAMAGQVGALQAQGPSAYTPTTSALENQVTSNAASMTPAGDYSAGTAAYGGVPGVTPTNVEGQSLLTGFDQYMSPYLKNVVGSTLSDYDLQAGQTRAAQAALGAMGKAFQGSRFGIQEGETEGQLARGRSATEGGLLNTGFNTAAGLSAQDAAARQQALEANQQAGLTAQQANQQAELARAAGLTGIDTQKNAQQLAQAQYQAGVGQRATEEQQIQQQYPLTFAAQNEGLLSGLNPALFTGSTASGTGTSHGTQVVSDPLGQISSLMAGAGGLFKGVTGLGIPGV